MTVKELSDLLIALSACGRADDEAQIVLYDLETSLSDRMPIISVHIGDSYIAFSGDE